nr:hypothetical protein [Tanacetum cinerariifolium]
QGHTQEDGIDYEEVFALVVKIEAIILFLAYASFMGFMVYQMDVKSAFLYETMEEEVYVYQPPRFEDPDYPNKVYVDDIIFGSINKDLCKAFEKLMKDKFQMSSMGEITFFLGLQVKQKPDGIFIRQGKYVAKILRKFGLTDGKSASTPIDTKKPLLKDPDGKDVDVHTYRLYAAIETPKWTCLLTEFCPGGDLHVLRQRQLCKRFLKSAVRFYASELVDPARRLGSTMGASAIKHHSFFQGVKWALLRCAKPLFVPPPFNICSREVVSDDSCRDTPVDYY